MGVLGPVFRAQGRSRAQVVAVKAFKLDVPPEQAPAIADALRALVAEAGHLSGLVPLVGAGLEADTPWLAMEFVSLPTLDARLRDGVGLAPDRALALVRALAATLDAMHARGFRHGSLHPRDIFLGEDDTCLVNGVGVADALAVAGVRPPARRPYSAPETLAGERIDAAADRYALGAIAYELVTGRRLLGSGDDVAGRLDLRGAAGDAELAATAFSAMLAARPDHRPSTAQAFASALSLAIAPEEAATVVKAMPAAPDVGSVTPGGGAAFAAERSGGSRPDADPDAAPNPELLEQFTRQGTLWEPPVDAAARPSVQGVVPTETVVDVSMEAPPLGAWADEPGADTLRRPAAAPHVPDLDPPLRQRGDVTSLGLSLREPLPAVDPPAEAAKAEQDAGPPVDPRPAAPAETEAAAGSPPLVVLALVLALGLAVGGAGGYLLGQRSGERAAQRALGGETDLGSNAVPSFEPAPATPAPAPEPIPDQPAPASEPGERAVPPRPRERAPVASGQIVVRSTPPKAGVIVNGTWRGRTPLTLRSLALGTYTVRVVADGYAPETRRVSIDARVPAATVAVQLSQPAGPARPAPAAPRPAATTGSLFLESRPAGARVFVDGAPVGTTPLLLSDLAPGAKAIRIEYPGHRPWSTSVMIVAGQRQRVAASLEEGF